MFIHKKSSNIKKKFIPQIKVDNVEDKKINDAQQIIDSMNPQKGKVKVIKKEPGLIEKKESDKIILAEDNRQVIFG